MSFERVDDPYRSYKGERPYEGMGTISRIAGNVKNYLSRIPKRTVRGVLGGLTESDAFGSIGPDDVDPGFFGSLVAGARGATRGTDLYDAQILAQQDKATASDLARRRVVAEESRAESDRIRANKYQPAGGTTLDWTQKANARMDWYNSLDEEGKKQAIAAGLIPREPRDNQVQDNEDLYVTALQENYADRGMTEADARLLARVKTVIDTSANTLLKDKNGRAIGIGTKRTFAIPQIAKDILARYGLQPDEVFGMVPMGGDVQYQEGTPQSKAEVDSVEDLSILQKWLESGTLDPVQLAWITMRLEELNGEVPGENDEIDNGGP